MCPRGSSHRMYCSLASDFTMTGVWLCYYIYFMILYLFSHLSLSLLGVPSFLIYLYASSAWHFMDLSRYLNEWWPKYIWMLQAGISCWMQVKLLCVWSCFCVLIFSQKAKEVNYNKSFVKVQSWNISSLCPIFFFKDVLLIFQFMCICMWIHF